MACMNVINILKLWKTSFSPHVNMLYSVLLFACIFSLFDVSIEGPVIELSDENFSQEIANHELILVEFFAPWCGHCQTLAPHYLKAAEELQSSSPPIPLASVDCIGVGDSICKSQRIEGFPTLKIFRNGRFSADYTGPLEADRIVTYMKRQAAPSSMYISSEEKLQEFITDTLPSIVGFFKLDSDSVIRDSFVESSEKLKNEFRFAHTYQSVSDLGQETVLPENVDGEQVWLYQPFRLRSKLDTPAVRIPESDSEKMQEFITKNFMGLVGIRDINYLHYYDSPHRRPQFIFYTRIDWDLNRKTLMYWRNRILKLARKYESKMFFDMSDSTVYAEELMDKFGISQTDQMQAVIFSEGKKYVMSQEPDVKMSSDLLSEFIKDFFDGKITHYLKSAPVPVEDSGPVKEVVGSTFEEIVMENDKDVMIEFYAPWCGHCKSLAPIFDELGVKLENNSNVVIAKLDAMTNDFPEAFNVEGFPTLYWVPAHRKDNPVKYVGGREVTDFLSYIEKQATIPFNTSDESDKEEL